MIELTPVRKERIQGKITKIILADQGLETINQIIAVNELTEEQANEMVQVARKERINRIRQLQMKGLYLGCVIMILGMAALYTFALLIGHVSRPIWCLTGLLMLMGLWKVVQSIIGIALAGSKKGQVTIA